MTVLVPIALFGWVPITIAFFFAMSPRAAVVCSVVGGVLLLPMASYHISGIPTYDKSTAIVTGLLAGSLLSNARGNGPFKWRLHDFPMLLWCFFCPFATSLSNGLGWYDGLSNMLTKTLNWGVFYWAGRKYFGEPSSLRELSRGIVFGGLIYLPLCAFEIRMSPQLSNIVYGFFPHQFIQHIRYGGFRPIVFMQHGLMVALWMAAAFTVSFWLWRSKDIENIKGIPMGLVVLALLVVTILCRSANGWFFLFAGSAAYAAYRRSRSLWLWWLAILMIPAYAVLRATGAISLESIQGTAAYVFDAERVHSLTLRLIEEDLFSARALLRPVFGWGGWDRGWPIDPVTGERLVQSIDGQWLITFSRDGLVGLFCLYSAMLIGPFSIFVRYSRSEHRAIQKESPFSIDAIVLALVVVFFMVDSLLNGTPNPVYVLCAGALVSYVSAKAKVYLPETNTVAALGTP